jgi:hypothetical protein
VPVHVDAELRGREEPARAVTVVSLSVTGALVRGATGVQIDERVALVLRLGAEEVELPAAVARLDPDDEFAVRFEELPRAAAGALERFVAAEQRRLL